MNEELQPPDIGGEQVMDELNGRKSDTSNLEHGIGLEPAMDQVMQEAKEA